MSWPNWWSLNTSQQHSVVWSPLIWRECGIRLMTCTKIDWDVSLYRFWMSLDIKHCKKKKKKVLLGLILSCGQWTKFSLQCLVKNLFVIPTKVSVKELRWQVVFTGCGCIYRVYHHQTTLLQSSRKIFVYLKKNHIQILPIEPILNC